MAILWAPEPIESGLRNRPLQLTLFATERWSALVQSRHRATVIAGATAIRERNRDYERRNRAQASDRYRRWVEANRDRAKEITLAFHIANPGKHAEYARRYRYAHPEARARARDRDRLAVDGCARILG